MLAVVGMAFLTHSSSQCRNEKDGELFSVLADGNEIKNDLAEFFNVEQEVFKSVSSQIIVAF